MSRLPQLRPSLDTGTVYVVQDGDAFKIGFTRNGLHRRVRTAGGQLVLTIQTGQRPSILEYLINNRFASKRLPGYKPNEGGMREWFKLDASDLEWLRGLADFMDETVKHDPLHNLYISDPR